MTTTNKPTDPLIQFQQMVLDIQEKALEDFDFDHIFDVNDRVRAFFEQYHNDDGIKLMDRMTQIMNNLKTLVDFVKSRRMSLEMGKKELEEFRAELREITTALETFMKV